MKSEIWVAIITGAFGLIGVLINKAWKKKQRAKENDLLAETFESEEIQEITYPIENEIILDGVCIFMLDDNKDDIHQVKRIVTKMGEKLKGFTDERDYLGEISDKPNIHIVDHFLTQMYGLDIMREIIKKNKNNFRILYSGTENIHTISEYNKLKINAIIDKNDKDHLRELEKAIREGLVYIRGLS